MCKSRTWRRCRKKCINRRIKVSLTLLPNNDTTNIHKGLFELFGVLLGKTFLKDFGDGLDELLGL